MRKRITVGVRVSANWGDFFPIADSQRRQKRGLWYGVVVESVEGGTWKVNWDNGRSTVEKYNQLQVEKENSGRLPLLPISPINNIPQQPSRNDDEDHIERPDACRGVEVAANGDLFRCNCYR